MTNMIFPDDPLIGDTVETGGRIWEWDGERWLAVFDSGYKGSTGYTGSEGVRGSVGYKGSVGDPGGSTGYTGSGGAGYTGSIGDIGPVLPMIMNCLSVMASPMYLKWKET